MTERQVRDNILKELKGLFVMPLSDRYASGYPDLLVIYNPVRDSRARVIFLEIKKPGGVVSKIQQYYNRKLNELGVEAYIVYSAGEVRGIIDGNRLRP